jgi:hypothetical protein
LNEDHFIAYGNCWSCGRGFSFDPDLVPSVPIDPQTRKPPDVDPIEGGYERAVKQPICEQCIEMANEKRVADGREPIVVLPGAWG